MLRSIKSKFDSIQQDFKDNVRIFPEKAAPARSPQTRHVHKLPINECMGCELLQMFEAHWKEIHTLNAENADRADEIADAVDKVCRRFRADLQRAERLTADLSSLPDISESVQEISRTIGNIYGLVEEIDSSLTSLEESETEICLQHSQLDAKLAFAIEKDRKVADLQRLESQLSDQMSLSRHSSIQNDRQQVFEERFQEDMKEYRENPHSIKTSKIASQQSLDEINLEDDGESARFMDEFLNKTDSEPNISGFTA